ncbi:thiopeptide maturation pyridine synthase [Streptomyces sp. NPDC047028]|uniref:thiopeptide maturation pyridine synthase n=1 Tax=Streptomyces sp. NPDC047028 TaxID=3155793 RepID=UPI0033EDE9E6
MGAVAWHGARVYYRGDITDLVLDAVRPLFERLERSVVLAYHAPGWRRGPHLQMNVLCDLEVYDSVVRPSLEECIGSYLRQHPGPTTLDGEWTARQLAKRAELELSPEPYWPLADPNTIRFESTAHFGVTDPVQMDLLTRFLSATTPLSFTMLEEVRRGRTVESVAYDLLIATAHTMCKGPGGVPALVHGFAAFRGHAEGFIAACGDAEGMRSRLDGLYQSRRAALIRRLDRVIAAVDHEDPELPMVRPWVEVATPFRDEAHRLLAGGAMSLPRPGHHGVSSDILRQAWIDNSEVLSTIRDSEVVRRYLYEDPDFQPYRVMLSYTYLHLRRLGLAAPQRFALCHLAANAVEDRFGGSALQKLRSVAAGGSGAQATGGGRP